MSAPFDAVLAPAALADARAGRSSGQEAIYRTFQRAVYNLARRMTDCPDTAFDITQNTFLRAFRCLAQYRGDAPFGHWLRTIAATEALMHLRQGRRFRELFVPQEDYVAEIVGVEDVSTADLERTLALLPPLPRSVLWLYHVEGYTHPEIAQFCGKTVSFSKSQLSRAHQKLRELLEIDAPTPARPTPAIPARRAASPLRGDAMEFIS